MIVLNSRRQTFLHEQLGRSRRDEVTYTEVGGTRWSDLPAGYRHDQSRLRLGHDEIAWRLAKDAIRQWKAHEHVGITLTPADTELHEGTTVLASRNLGPVAIVAPCRIIYVTDEPSRFGFAYGTLPGHPEKGEEAFHVFLNDQGRCGPRSPLSPDRMISRPSSPGRSAGGSRWR